MTLCARPGCSGAAVATFVFDSTACIVWIDDLGDDRPAGFGGRLCRRHADALSPPRGWRVDDRRVAVPPPPRPAPVASARVDDPLAPRPDTPLLTRAFRAAGAA